MACANVDLIKISRAVNNAELNLELAKEASPEKRLAARQQVLELTLQEINLQEDHDTMVKGVRIKSSAYTRWYYQQKRNDARNRFAGLRHDVLVSKLRAAQAVAEL